MAKTANMKKSRINRRIVNNKRHTTGFVITGGKKISRDQAVKMANKGELSGVRVVRGYDGNYIQSTTNRNLYQLPVDVNN